MFVSYSQSQLGDGHVDEECFVDSSAFLVTVIIIITTAHTGCPRVPTRLAQLMFIGLYFLQLHCFISGYMSGFDAICEIIAL